MREGGERRRRDAVEGERKSKDAPRATAPDRETTAETGRTRLTVVDGVDVARRRERPNLLVVSLDATVSETAARYRRELEATPSRFGVVALGESAGETGRETGSSPGVSTASVDDATDVSGVVGAVESILETWVGPDTAVVLGGVAETVERADEETAFRFLHVLTHLVTVRGGHLSVTVDAERVDSTLFEPLFDDVDDRPAA